MYLLLHHFFFFKAKMNILFLKNDLIIKTIVFLLFVLTYIIPKVNLFKVIKNVSVDGKIRQKKERRQVCLALLME